MASGSSQILNTARDGFSAQESELATARIRQALSVITKTATGTGDMAEVLALDRRFRLVFIRCHFVGTPSSSTFTISLNSANGAAYDTRLFTITKAGTNRDVNFRIAATESIEPSPWTFQAGDAVRFRWTNPDSGNITWGLEVGFAIAT